MEPPLPQIAIAVVQRDQSFLIGQRPAGVPLAGLWEFPGGKVHPGESPAEAAVRECCEETDLVIEITGQYPSVRHEYPHGSLQLAFFQARPRDPQANPRPPFRWVPRAELDRYEFPAANQSLLAHLQRLAKLL